MTLLTGRGVSQGVKALSLCVLALFAAALAATVEPGRACSCAPPDPRSALARADAAFVGTLIKRRQLENRAVLVYTVEKSLKGPLGQTVEVVTARDGAGCGIEAPVGTRVGLTLDRRGGAWHGHLCAQFAPEDLLAAVAPLPPPNGSGPVALFVGGRFGEARTLALDAKGRTLVYGMGRGWTRLLSPCPGGRRVAEIAELGTGSELAIRDGTTLQVLRRQPIRLPGQRYPLDLLCEDVAGSSVVLFGIGAGDAPVGAALFRVAGDRLTPIWKGTAYLSSLTLRVAYLNAGERAARFVGVDLRTGRTTRLAWLPRSPRLEPDVMGRRFAGVAYRLDERSRIFLLDLTTRPKLIRSTPLAAPEAIGEVIWVSSRRLLFLPFDDRETARLLDLRLRTLSRFRWTSGQGALVASTVFGVDGRTLVRTRLPAGPAGVVRRLPGSAEVVVSAAS